MRSKAGSVPSVLRLAALVAVVVVLALAALAALPPQNAQAAGHWTTGVLTNNSVDDYGPRLSSTHLVWAQDAGANWNIRLRQISTGATKTIATIPHVSGQRPLLSIDGDYVTIYSQKWGSSADLFQNYWQLHTISTGVTRPFVPVVFAPGITSVTVASGHVIQSVNDGDGEVRAYNIAADEWIQVTDNSWGDGVAGVSHGRVLIESGRDLDRMVSIYSLATGSKTTIVTQTTDAHTGVYPQISGDWVLYKDLVSSFQVCLYRLADGLTLQVLPCSNFDHVLGDDHAAWTEPRGSEAEDGNDLYAFDLNTLQKTRLTNDTKTEQVVAVEGDRVFYLVYRSGSHGGGSDNRLWDVKVVDLSTTPLQPHVLVQNIKLGTTSMLTFGHSQISSACGDLFTLMINDGSDNEIAWALWVEDEEPPTFTDVPAGHPYREAVEGLAARGIVSGYDPTTFGPDDLVKRQQFAKMIVGTLGLTPVEADFPDPAAPFTDLGADDPSSLYPHEYVAVCARNQITLGKTPTTFDPYAYITRAQVISMVVRAADRLAPGTLATPGLAWTGALSYGDPTHGANIRRAEFNGLLAGIQGPAGTLAGWLTGGYATRGEVAQMLWNLLEKLE